MTDAPTPTPPPAWGTFSFNGQRIRPGASADVRLKVSETYTADPISIPVTVVRGRRPGPTLFMTASVHGDELNGVGIIRALLNDYDLSDLAGTLLAVPVANVPGFLQLERSLPDGRDLNRSFPGSSSGSLTARVAHILFQQVIRRSDFGLDLHTGGGERSNYPHVRADLDDPRVAELARAFGPRLVIHGTGPDRSLRRTAVRHGVATIVYEAGGPRRLEKPFIRAGLKGATNVLAHLKMIDGPVTPPPICLEARKTQWLRAKVGGILDLKVELGQPVRRGDVISVNTNPFGRERSQLEASFSGIVIGLTRIPLVHPGDAICHVARQDRRELEAWAKHWHRPQSCLEEPFHDDA